MLLQALMVVAASSLALAQSPAVPPTATKLSTTFIIDEHNVTRLSEHVYEIPDKNRPGIPNIAIIVGSRATLVVDTGMGPRSGEIVVREVQRLTKNTELYLATTDFRPEHITGGQAFPPSTVWLVPAAQKQDIDSSTETYRSTFASRSPDLAAALKGVALREPNIVFERDAQIDLGGVSVRLLWVGPARTNGDVVVWVEADGFLHAGNIFGSMSYPGMPDSTPSVANWLNVIDELEALHPKIVLPNHGAVRDGSLIRSQREVFRALQWRTRQLKAQGKTAEQAGQILTAEFDVQYPDTKGLGGIPAIVRRFYAEPQ
jgi:glyoxylase-like metal-dependent hydrolase (beta-lactamase superfamily II)